MAEGVTEDEQLSMAGGVTEEEHQRVSDKGTLALLSMAAKERTCLRLLFLV
jgi:hypothetical protein